VELPPALASGVRVWSSYYSDHQLVSVFVKYLHLAATVVGGGMAVTLDRQVIRALRGDDADRQQALSAIRGSHRVVVPALTLVAVTGLLMTAADLSLFLASTLFWVKMGLVAVLVMNGALLVAAETAVARAQGAVGWGRMAAVAVVSVTLWLVTLFVGTWLTVAA
jgi:hypothetical protein